MKPDQSMQSGMLNRRRNRVAHLGRARLAAEIGGQVFRLGDDLAHRGVDPLRRFQAIEGNSIRAPSGVAEPARREPVCEDVPDRA